MEWKELITKRRSIRNYAEGSVDHGDLVKILADAQQAPSWKNSQTARCYAVESPELIAQIREKALPSFNRKSSANAAFLVTTFVRDVAGHTHGEPDNELGNQWGAYDLGLRDAYLVLAARDAGYDTLIMGIRDSEKLREILSIPAEETIVSVIAIGKRADDPAGRPRKELEEVVTFIPAE